VIEGRGRTGFAPEAFQGLNVVGEFFREKLQAWNDGDERALEKLVPLVARKINAPPIAVFGSTSRFPE
jgi:hypothetical protein